MSANNDNAMARFLFAILKQKCLKDIDWNKVAHDPILAQEITNGHAARMRYSRFRSAMLGLEPQRRNKKDANRSKVTKPKKEPKTKKDDAVKPEPGSETASVCSGAEASSHRVKQEISLLPTESQPTQPTFPGVAMPDAPSQFHNRLLTPCSDVDLMPTTGGYTASPASEMVHSETSLDFATGSTPCSYEQALWQQNSPYGAFTMPYDFDGYSMGLCEHQQAHHNDGGLGVPTPSGPSEPGHATVKHEDWDAHFH